MESKMYRLKDAAKVLGVSVDTLRRWEREGKLRLSRTAGGWRRVPAEELQRLLGSTPPAERRVWALYARVSSHEQKAKGDLSRQVAYLRQAVGELGGTVEYAVTDVSSGLSDRRPGLRRLMALAAKGEITDLAITYKDRLTRFGFGYLEEYFASHGVRLHLVDGEEDKKSLQEELVADLLAIVTSFSGRLYGLRSHSRAKALVSAVKAHVPGRGEAGYEPGEQGAEDRA